MFCSRVQILELNMLNTIMGRMSVYTSEYPLSYHWDHYDNWRVKDHILLSWKDLYIFWSKKLEEHQNSFFVCKGTDSLTFQWEPFINLLLSRERRIQYFSLHSPSVKEGTGKGWLVPDSAFESNLSCCWYKPSDHMLTANAHLPSMSEALYWTKRKTALHLTTAKSFVG